MNRLVPQCAHRAAFVLSTFAVICGSAGLALAQKPKPSDSDVSLARSQAVLKDRDREMMHPGNPLTIVGAEQGGNDIRSRTPILARSDRIATLVDPDENYRRTIAMYEEGASFRSAPASAMPAESAAASRNGPRRSARPDAADPTGEGAVSGGREWPWVLGFGMCALLGLWVFMRPRVPVLARSPIRSRST